MVWLQRIIEIMEKRIIFGQDLRDEKSQATQWAAQVRKSMSKGPEAGKQLPNSRNIKEDCMTTPKMMRRDIGFTKKGVNEIVQSITGDVGSFHFVQRAKERQGFKLQEDMSIFIYF